MCQFINRKGDFTMPQISIGHNYIYICLLDIKSGYSELLNVNN